MIRLHFRSTVESVPTATYEVNYRTLRILGHSNGENVNDRSTNKISIQGVYSSHVFRVDVVLKKRTCGQKSDTVNTVLGEDILYKEWIDTIKDNRP